MPQEELSKNKKTVETHNDPVAPTGNESESIPSSVAPGSAQATAPALFSKLNTRFLFPWTSQSVGLRYFVRAEGMFLLVGLVPVLMYLVLIAGGPPIVPAGGAAAALVATFTAYGVLRLRPLSTGVILAGIAGLGVLWAVLTFGIVITAILLAKGTMFVAPITFGSALIWGLFIHRSMFSSAIPFRKGVNYLVFNALIAIPVLAGLLTKRSLGSLKGPLDWILHVGIPEECVKIVVLGFVALRLKNVKDPNTVIFLALMSGLGFAVFENALFHRSFFEERIQWQALVQPSYRIPDSDYMTIGRSLLTTPLHGLWSVIAGAGLALSRCVHQHRKTILVAGLMAAALLHGLYDYYAVETNSVIGSLMIVVTFWCAFLAIRFVRVTAENPPVEFALVPGTTRFEASDREAVSR